jgi:hypothetical protein
MSVVAGAFDSAQPIHAVRMSVVAGAFDSAQPIHEVIPLAVAHLLPPFDIARVEVAPFDVAEESPLPNVTPQSI